MKRFFFGALIVAAGALFSAPPAAASPADFGDSPGPRVVFSKSFPGSIPDFFRVTVAETGEANYQVKPVDDPGVDFRMAPELARQVFDLATRLGHFRGEPLETKRKLAMMGIKTVAWLDGNIRQEQSFNYSENPDARELVSLFERISNTHQHRVALERLIRFDKLGLVKQLLNMEIALSKNDLAEPRLLLPLLQEISRNKSVMNIAQERARNLASRIESGK